MQAVADFIEAVFEGVFIVEWATVGLIAMGITEIFGDIAVFLNRAVGGADSNYQYGDVMRSWWSTLQHKWEDLRR